MWKKVLYIFMILLICAVMALVCFFNIEQIEAFINGADWSYLEKRNDIKENAPIEITGSNIITITSNKAIGIYSKTGEKLGTNDVTSASYLVDSSEDYSAIYSNDTNTLFLFKGQKLNSKISLNLDVKRVSVNKNGDVVVIFLQNGYKSGVKVYSAQGIEKLTTYLANSYAVQGVLSDDGKYLYIAEIDTSGVLIKSSIKVVEMTKISGAKSQEEYIKEYSLPEDELLVKIKLNKNDVIAYSMSNIYSFNMKLGFEKITSLDESRTLFVSVDGDYPVVISRDVNDNVLLEIYGNEKKQETLDGLPEDVSTFKDKICVNFGDEIAIFNSNARIIYKIKVSNKVEKMHIFNNGKSLAVMYRDKVELYDI